MMQAESAVWRLLLMRDPDPGGVAEYVKTFDWWNTVLT
jgi:hypothetical protein